MIPLLLLGGWFLLPNHKKKTRRRRKNPADSWAGADKVIRKTFRSAASYAIIDAHRLGDTWNAGGCWVAAAAIARCFGGDLIGVWVGDQMVTHVAVRKGDTIIDADGKPLPQEAFLRRYAKRERLPRLSIRPVDPSGAGMGGIRYSAEAVAEAAKLLCKKDR